MNDATLLTTGIAGTVIAVIGCATPAPVGVAGLITCCCRLDGLRLLVAARRRSLPDT